jgi:hypothetical protein
VRQPTKDVNAVSPAQQAANKEPLKRNCNANLTGAAKDVGHLPDRDPTAPSIAPAAGLSIPPAPVTVLVDSCPCGRPQLS